MKMKKVKQLEGQYLTNPYHSDKVKYKLKPLVSDDDVYRCIIEDNFDQITDMNSNVLKNYNYIVEHLNTLVEKGYNANNILLALDKLYVVSVPISEEDNAQKIFESINATGVKLTAADLIRNYLLMDLESDIQEQYYSQYWRKIENLVSQDSKILEMFFRMFLAIKTYILIPRNAVYREFVEWRESHNLDIDLLFEELLEYANIFYLIMNVDLGSIKKELKVSIGDFRKIKSDLPMSIVMEFYRLYRGDKINVEVLSNLIAAINAYLIRRSLCDMDSQNISKLFPSVLKKTLEKCNGNYDEILNVLNQELVGNNANTSGSYMPTDRQMKEFLHSANVYKRPALRIVLDRLELNNNPAPVDLSVLSIEHLMPQTPTEEWLEELDTDEETYFENLHRLGNLTLATKHDNSKMGNLNWSYKNKILEDTAHLTLNIEINSIEKWNLDCIENRTKILIERICDIYSYSDVSIAKDEDSMMVDGKTAVETAVKLVSKGKDIVVVKKNSVYKTDDNQNGYAISSSKMYSQGDKEKYWFGYRERRFDEIKNCNKQYSVLVCRNDKTTVFKIPKEFMDKHLSRFNMSFDDEDNVTHYHIVIFKNSDGRNTMLLSRPTLEEIDITEYLVGCE